MRGLRIALVLATSSGGVGNHVRSLVGGLRARGQRVAVIGPPDTERRFGFTEMGARFTAVRIGELPRPGRDLAAAGRLRHLLSGADVVHAHGLRAGAISALAAFPLLPGARSVPLAVTLHNAPPEVPGPLNAVYPLLERVVARRADVVLGVSGDLEERMRRLNAHQVRRALVSAPALGGASRPPEEVRAELGITEARPLLLTVARLAAQKGLNTLLDASRYWARRDPPPLVVVAGDGPLRGELAARVEAEELPVRLLGHRTDIPDLLAAADMFVLSSLWEGPSLVIMEALRAGLPVVATRVGGIPDLYSGVASLVPPSDAAAFAAAVASILDDPKLAERMRRSAATAAATLPTEEAAVAQLLTLYREMASR